MNIIIKSIITIDNLFFVIIMKFLVLNIESAYLSTLIIVDVIFFDVSHTPQRKKLGS